MKAWKMLPTDRRFLITSNGKGSHKMPELKATLVR